MHDKTVMVHFFAEILPFAIFAAIAIFAVAEKGSPSHALETANVPRPRKFCGYVEGEGLVMADPDGTVVTRSR